MYSVCEVCVAAHYICCSKDLLMIIKHNQHLNKNSIWINISLTAANQLVVVTTAYSQNNDCPHIFLTLVPSIEDLCYRQLLSTYTSLG